MEADTLAVEYLMIVNLIKPTATHITSVICKYLYYVTFLRHSVAIVMGPKFGTLIPLAL